mgnify:CR=1 FL=1
MKDVFKTQDLVRLDPLKKRERKVWTSPKNGEVFKYEATHN